MFVGWQYHLSSLAQCLPEVSPSILAIIHELGVKTIGMLYTPTQYTHLHNTTHLPEYTHPPIPILTNFLYAFVNLCVCEVCLCVFFLYCPRALLVSLRHSNDLKVILDWWDYRTQCDKVCKGETEHHYNRSTQCKQDNYKMATLDPWDQREKRESQCVTQQHDKCEAEV